MFSNKYIIIYLTVLVSIVAIALTFVAVSLKPKQESNIRIEKMQNILSSANVESSVENAESLYKKNIQHAFVINHKGEIVKNIDAFSLDLYMELKKPLEKRNFPVFVSTNNGDSLYIMPLRGKGLWGPIWGYIALKNDFNTIAGAVFDHKGETPGLGAEINTTEFEQKFLNKQIFDQNENFVSVKVIKGIVKPDDLHSVDAISGGTITSKGLEDMIFNGLSSYLTFIKKTKK
ncbi:MAG TPA: NADH:ubiquinone reductase (Na(+)-transporting) subunit C [Bacteroidales bacterium]|nr:NADH:ubiquinone reductase (Na(+)-transporting) subunit C [Bacteroidales bacterium]